MAKGSNHEKIDTVYFRQIRVYDLLREILKRFNNHENYEEQKIELISIILHLANLSIDLNLKEPILSFKLTVHEKLINLTPLQAACAILDVQIVEILLENVGQAHLGINLQDRNGDTALHWVYLNHEENVEKTKIRELLIAHGADEQIRNKLGQTAKKLEPKIICTK